MTPLMPWVDQLAGEILGERCECYAEAFPAISCADIRSRVATYLALAYRRDHPSLVVAARVLRIGCACHGLLVRGAEKDGAVLHKQQDEIETARLIEAAFLARHMDEAHEQAIEQERTGG